MKHEYHFTISRIDRISLIAFVVFLLGWELIKHALPEAVSLDIKSDIPESTDTLSRVEPLYADVRDKKKYAAELSEDEDASIPNDDVKDEPAPVNIMEATWQDLRRIGFSAKAASNIEKYIAAGGVLRNEKDVLKIYGMDTSQWEGVSPYIIFPDTENDVARTSEDSEHKPAEAVILDLNTASVTDLESLPGIGMVLAERIIKYRTSLGGFFTVDQIKECYGLPPETFEKIKPRLTIIQPATTISINETDFTSFNHPYLNKKMIRLLQAYKKQHGPFQNASDLRKVYPPDSSWCEKLLPYIEFK